MPCSQESSPVALQRTWPATSPSQQQAVAAASFLQTKASGGASVGASPFASGTEASGTSAGMSSELELSLQPASTEVPRRTGIVSKLTNRIFECECTACSPR